MGFTNSLSKEEKREWDIHPLDVPLTEVMKNAAIYTGPM